MFCWETLGLRCHEDVILTRTVDQTISADQVIPSMAKPFPNGEIGQNNVPDHATNTIQECLESYVKEHVALIRQLPRSKPS